MQTIYNKFYIGGGWQTPFGPDSITVVSPNDESILGKVPEGRKEDIDSAVSAARTAFDDPQGWSRWEPKRRAHVLVRLAEALESREDSMVQAISSQNGMPVSVSKRLEAIFPPLLLRYYADMINKDNFDNIRPGLLGGSTLVTREPIGVVGAIVPWNFPQTLAAFKYAPALAAGCTLVIKPSPETVFDSYVLAQAIEEAGIPAGVINIVPAGREAGAYLVSHPAVDKIAFTGSSSAGRHIAEACGRLLRPVTLELGGKSAAILLEDADLDLTVMGERLFMSTLLNNGQTCFLGTRILAPRSRYDEVIETFSALAKSLVIGSSLDPDTQVGPLTTEAQRARVESYFVKGKAEGARIITGGKRPESLPKGWFVEPTIFADVDSQSTLAQEEIFGPVLSIIPYDGEDEAVRIANDSQYGLGGSIWTKDHDRGVTIARRIQTGTIGINNYLPDPTAPFGGIKSSGLGRELGPEALDAYLNTKSIYL